MILVILLIRLGALAEISMRFFILRTKRANRDLLIAPNTFTTRLHDFLLISLYWTFIIHSQILKKMLLATLDGFFVTREWMEKLPKTHLIGLPKPVSDHSLFTIETCLPKGDPTPFRIKNMWLQHKDFYTIIKNWWTESLPARGANSFSNFDWPNLSSKIGIKKFLASSWDDTKTTQWDQLPDKKNPILGSPKRKFNVEAPRKDNSNI